MKRLLKISFYLLLVLAAILTLQGALFHHALTSPVELQKADAVVVFMGDPARTAKGYALVESGLAPFLILSPANLERAASLQRNYGSGRGTFRHLIEERAATTFQNAQLTGRLIRAQEFTRVLLVTDDWHMPRAWLLLELALWREGVEVIRCPVKPGGFTRSPLEWSTRQKKQVYNEMVECWGSLIEFAHYTFKGDLPPRNLKESEIISFLKSILLFALH